MIEVIKIERIPIIERGNLTIDPQCHIKQEQVDWQV